MSRDAQRRFRPQIKAIVFDQDDAAGGLAIGAEPRQERAAGRVL
jgi:hypothetical protein